MTEFFVISANIITHQVSPVFVTFRIFCCCTILFNQRFPKLRPSCQGLWYFIKTLEIFLLFKKIYLIFICYQGRLQLKSFSRLTPLPTSVRLEYFRIYFISDKQKEGGGWKYHIKYKVLFYLFSKQAIKIQVSPDWYSFITDISSQNSQLTPYICCMLRKEVKQSVSHYQTYPSRLEVSSQLGSKVQRVTGD